MTLYSTSEGEGECAIEPEVKLWIEPEGKLTGTVPHATIRERVGKEIPDPILHCSLGLLPVPPIGQAQPEVRAQGTPVRGVHIDQLMGIE